MFTQDYLQQNDISEDQLRQNIKKYAPQVTDEQIDSFLAQAKEASPDATNMQLFYMLAENYINQQRMKQSGGKFANLRQKLSVQ